MTLSEYLASTAVTGVVAVAAVTQAIPVPESVWPTSVTGWLTTVGVIVTVVAFIRNTHKQGVERAERQVSEAARVTAIDTRLNNFGERVDHQMNGYGKRLERVESDAESDRIAVNGLLQSMAETRAERKHHGESLERIERSLEEMRHDRATFEQRLVDVLSKRP